MRRTALLSLLLVGCGSSTEVDWHEPVVEDATSPVVSGPLALSGHDGAPAIVIPSDATLPVRW